jgi:hypothetical protein
MRQFYAMIGLAMICVMLLACQRPQFALSVTPVSSSTIGSSPPTPTPIGDIPSWARTVAPTPSIAPPLRFTAVAKPTRQPVTPARPTSQPTPSPVPTLRFTSAITVPLPCDPRPGVAWRTWRGPEVMPVLALLTERETLWVSTWSGVFQVDPRTGVFTRTLSFDVADGVRELFPLGEGRLWAGTDYGAFYYDGQKWSTIQISGTHGSPYVIGIDRNGDLWAITDRWAPPHYYRFSGHLPPPHNGLWIATPVPSFVPQPDTCEMQTAVWYVLPLEPPYRSPEECRAIQKARQMVTVPDSIYLPTILSADRGIWWLSNREAYDQPLRLGNIDQGKMMTLELPIHSVSSTAPDPQHGMWLGTERGLLYSNGEDLRLWDLAGLDACLGPNWVEVIAIDPKGTAWALTSSDGVYTLPPGVVEWQHVADPTQTGQSTLARQTDGVLA